MSKKASQKEQRAPKEALDEENEPFLRAIQKKIRNINKKITEIGELAVKDNLKPEQIEKVNRKPQLVQDREKLEKDLEMFREVYEDNKEHYRNQQLKELQNLAQAVTVFLAFPQFEGANKLAELWKGINSVKGQNLNEAVTNLSSTLKQLANDWKLQKSLKKFSLENGTAEIKEQITTLVQTEVHTDEVIVYHEETVNEKGEREEVDVVEKIHDGKVEGVEVEVKTVLIDSQAPPQNQSEVPEKAAELKENKEKEERAKKPRQDRPRNNHENRENREQNKEPRKYQEKRETGRRDYKEGDNKKAYRPKYVAREAEKEKRDSSYSSEEEVKSFKKDEIKLLEEDGFIVVGKAKPKPVQRQQNRRVPAN